MYISPNRHSTLAAVVLQLLLSAAAQSPLLCVLHPPWLGWCILLPAGMMVEGAHVLHGLM